MWSIPLATPQYQIEFGEPGTFDLPCNTHTHHTYVVISCMYVSHSVLHCDIGMIIILQESLI